MNLVHPIFLKLGLCTWISIRQKEAKLWKVLQNQSSYILIHHTLVYTFCWVRMGLEPWYVDWYWFLVTTGVMCRLVLNLVTTSIELSAGFKGYNHWFQF